MFDIDEFFWKFDLFYDSFFCTNTVYRTLLYFLFFDVKVYETDVHCLLSFFFFFFFCKTTMPALVQRGDEKKKGEKKTHKELLSKNAGGMLWI